MNRSKLSCFLSSAAFSTLSKNNRPNPFVSSSRFSEKRGKIHGSSFRQLKGRLSEQRTVPSGSVPYPPYLTHGVPSRYPEPAIHSPARIAAMRRASAIASEVLSLAGEQVKEGVSTDEIDEFVHKTTLRLGAYPSPLGYMGFPKSVCASVNEVVCHGIPDMDCVLKRGDIVKLDVSCFVDGVHGDTCRTFVAGDKPGNLHTAQGVVEDNLSAAKMGHTLSLYPGDQVLDSVGRHLIATTKRSLNAAIAICGPGVSIKSIGDTIGGILDKERLEGVTSFAGHGIGEVFHTEPIVYHHPNSSKYIMKPGMTFTIEPMVVEGSNEIHLWPDGWAVVTTDGGRAAQFEHTLLVTDHGVDVLTKYDQ